MRVIEMRKELDKYADNAEVMIVVDGQIYPFMEVARLGVGKEGMEPDDMALIVETA